MKTILMLTTLIALVIGMISAVNAQCAGDSLPPEIRILVGTKFSPKIVGVEQAGIPGFSEVNGSLLVDAGDQNESVVAYSEGLLEGKWPIYFLERIYPDRAMEILDVQVLPANLLDWHMVNGKPKGINGRFKMSQRCRANDKDSRIILGLVKPEHNKANCAHFSKRVKQAWQIDLKSGCIIPIATEGLQCEYITMNDCY